MSRENGPIWVFSREDTIPTDSEGGYAGGDSTAYAVGMSLDQSSKALGTVDNLAVTASTLDYGQEATATISGAAPFKTIHVGIPKGMPDTVGAQLTADAAASADAATLARDDADAAVLLAQQAQAAAYNVPDVAMRDIINNPATETVGALQARESSVTVVDFGAVGDGVTDDTAAIQAALDSLNGTHGGTVSVPPSSSPYRIDGSLVVGPRDVLEIAGGAELTRLSAYSTSTAPVVVLNGNHARLAGAGLVESQNASPHGVVMFGPTTITRRTMDVSATQGSTTLTSPSNPWTVDDVGKTITVWSGGGAGQSGAKWVGTVAGFIDAGSITMSTAATATISGERAYWGEQRSVCWAQLDPGIRVRGNAGTNATGIFLNSSPQGQSSITLGCLIQGQVDFCSTAVHFSYQANANQVVNLQVYRVTDAVYFFEDAVENSVLGGFMHGSHTAQALVRGEFAIFNSVLGQMAEPGGSSAAPYDFDALSDSNTVHIMNNMPRARVDLGTRNTGWLRDEFLGQRIEASDGVRTFFKNGPVTDADFSRPAVSGMLAMNTGGAVIYGRFGSTWKPIRAQDRDLRENSSGNFENVLAHSTVDVTVPIAGAQVGDIVTIVPRDSAGTPAGTIWQGWVSAPGVVTWRVANVTVDNIFVGIVRCVVHVLSRT